MFQPTIEGTVDIKESPAMLVKNLTMAVVVIMKLVNLMNITSLGVFIKLKQVSLYSFDSLSISYE